MFRLGEIVLLDFPYTNRAGSKVRPGLVIAVNCERYGDLQVAYRKCSLSAGKSPVTVA